MEPLRISAYTLYVTNKCIGLHFTTTDIGLSSLKFFWWAPEFLLISFRSSKVDKFAANRKRVCDFLLVRNSNFSPILHRFGVLIGFMTPIQPQFWGCSRCTRSPMLGISQHMGPKLFGREIFFRRIPTYLNTVPDRYRQMDRQTDDLLSHNHALR